ncbi:helix-turn-helix transcriptional regulator [Pontibacterium sp.]|uniref:helix-turn-helix transcriptional regulator n=1 Tax=Pontibacterium sp. TaxID=2036026 RepID=UPI003513B572
MSIQSQILRRRDVEKAVGLSCSTIYRMMDAGTFPKPIRLTPSRVGWKESDIQKWIEDRSSESLQVA